MKKARFPSRSLLAALCVGAVSLTAAPQAAAQGYPSKNIVIILPYTAGGSTDVIARAVAQRLGEALGRNAIVENRPGASGMIGAEMAAKAEPDGHTLISTTSSYPGSPSTGFSVPM